VALISTTGKDGVKNIAPWSCISPVLRPLEEVMLATGEFVINIPSFKMLEEVMICAKMFPPEIDEFVVSKLKPKKSSKVKVPGIEGTLAQAECVLVEEVSRQKYSLIIGKVVHLEVDEDYFDLNGDMNIEKARPLVAVIGEKGTWFTYPVSEGRFFPHRQMSPKQE